jgi:hypothetical protein
MAELPGEDSHALMHRFAKHPVIAAPCRFTIPVSAFLPLSIGMPSCALPSVPLGPAAGFLQKNKGRWQWR